MVKQVKHKHLYKHLFQLFEPGLFGHSGDSLIRQPVLAGRAKRLLFIRPFQDRQSLENYPVRFTLCSHGVIRFMQQQPHKNQVEGYIWERQLLSFTFLKYPRQ